jgi:hypothetical protein
MSFKFKPWNSFWTQNYSSPTKILDGGVRSYYWIVCFYAVIQVIKFNLNTEVFFAYKMSIWWCSDILYSIVLLLCHSSHAPRSGKNARQSVVCQGGHSLETGSRWSPWPAVCLGRVSRGLEGDRTERHVACGAVVRPSPYSLSPVNLAPSHYGICISSLMLFRECVW